MPQLNTVCHQMEPSEQEARGVLFILLSHWPTVLRGTSQTSQLIVRAVGCSSQSDNKAALLKTTHVIEHGKVQLALNWSFTPADWCS